MTTRKVEAVVRRLAFVVALFLPGIAWATDADDPDACAKARAVDVLSLITPEHDVEIRSLSGHPAAGESTCVWSAAKRGLTDAAPPVGRLTIAFYHLASPARAKDQMRRLAKIAQPPSLVRTRDADDQVLRPDADSVVARHGSDIAVVDASQTRSLARQHAGWTYRLESMALAAAGSEVSGPVDARATAPVCRLVAAERVLALLTLSPSTLPVPQESNDDGLRCYFSVKDGSRKPAGWVDNRGTAQFRREDLGTNAAALERLHADHPFERPSMLVATTDATDRVVATAGHPEEVEAVHGPYLVTLHLTDVTDAARAHPTWAYRVQRTALEAAGASIVVKSDAPLDPVTPGPAPPPAAFAWRTSGHVASPWATWLNRPVHVLAFAARNRFYLMPVLIFGSILAAVLAGRRRQPTASRPAIIGYEPDPPRRKARGVILVPLCIALAVVNLVFGTEIAGALIFRIGAEGRATIVASHSTGVVYNSRRVYGHDVLIKTDGGRVIETSFEDDDFNVYPSHNRTRYPSGGDRFNVRYLVGFPRDFVILGEDDSPWAHDKRCADLAMVHASAEKKRDFAPDVVSYQTAAAEAANAEAAAGCTR